MRRAPTSQAGPSHREGTSTSPRAKGRRIPTATSYAPLCSGLRLPAGLGSPTWAEMLRAAAARAPTTATRRRRRALRAATEKTRGPAAAPCHQGRPPPPLRGHQNNARPRDMALARMRLAVRTDRPRPTRTTARTGVKGLTPSERLTRDESGQALTIRSGASLAVAARRKA